MWDFCHIVRFIFRQNHYSHSPSWFVSATLLRASKIVSLMCILLLRNIQRWKNISFHFYLFRWRCFGSECCWSKTKKVDSRHDMVESCSTQQTATVLSNNWSGNWSDIHIFPQIFNPLPYQVQCNQNCFQPNHLTCKLSGLNKGTLKSEISLRT